MTRAAEKLCLVGPAGTGKSHLLGRTPARGHQRRDCGFATSPPPISSRPTTAVSPTVAKIIDAPGGAAPVVGMRDSNFPCDAVECDRAAAALVIGRPAPIPSRGEGSHIRRRVSSSRPGD